MLYNDKATAALRQRPNCDICATTLAAVDGKTNRGPWGYMCQHCHGRMGVGLGLGRGQVLICGDKLDQQLVNHYHLEEEDAKPKQV